VFEDEDLLVVDKPEGLLTSTVPREPRATLLAMVRDYVGVQGPGTPVGLIHRLDRDASGLLVFTKNRDAFRSLKRQFFDHSVERVYTAVIEGVPNPRAGTIDTRLVERADGTVYSLRRDAEGKGERAVSEYQTLATNGGRSAVRVTLLTGRKHQIRVHLSERGTPIVGDPVYGGEEAAPKKGKRARKLPPPPPAPRLMLAATKLSLTHPRTGMRMIFQLPPPKVFAKEFGAEIPVAPPPDGR
jgi:23S rRNA pseudouridine1911/1915/1917 synthase